MNRNLPVFSVGLTLTLLAALMLGLATTWVMAANEPAGPALLAPDQGMQSLGEPDTLSEMPIAEIHAPATAAAKPESIRALPNVNGSPLPVAKSCERSQQLENVARQADRQILHGFELAGRGAHFAARSEFIAALRLVAEGLDTEEKSSAHRRALAAALTALKEAEDFLPGGARNEANLDLLGIIGVHGTPVLKNNADNLTPLTALKCYFTFAQEQLAAAAGHEVAGSMALQGLGKLHAALAGNKNVRIIAAEPKAMVFYQAALLAYPRNFMAANDLGVLLAQCGNYAEARTMLEHSLALRGQSAGWQNLAVVYRQIGQPALAERAARQAAFVRQAEMAQRQMAMQPVQDMVRWTDPNTFAQTSRNPPEVARRPTPAPQPTTRR